MTGGEVTISAQVAIPLGPRTPSADRLHHFAWVVRDSEATRHFYEDLIGLPLVATWCEQDELGEYCHTFFGLGDGGALAFFQFADDENHERHRTRRAGMAHVALKVDAAEQEAARERLREGGVPAMTIDHGFCVSLYAADPDGLTVELTVDDADIEAIEAERRATAHADLARWLAGDRTPNNRYRR